MGIARLEADSDGLPDLLYVMLNVLLGHASPTDGGMRWGAKNRTLIIVPKMVIFKTNSKLSKTWSMEYTKKSMMYSLPS